MEILIFIILHWYLSLFCQTFFHHRYAAHRMFTMTKAWEKVFFVCSFITQGSSYLSPYAYGILHRLHHAYSDTDKDPHSPEYDKNLFSMMWRTKNIYNDLFYNRMEVEPQFRKDLPQWRPFEIFADKWPVRIFWVVAYTTFYVYFATSWWMFLFLPMHYVMGPLHGAIINWFAHKYGSIRFRLKDTSKNLFKFDFLMLGEAYHNNHHQFPSRPNFGFKWFEIDPVYPVIMIFKALRIIRMRRTA